MLLSTTKRFYAGRLFGGSEESARLGYQPLNASTRVSAPTSTGDLHSQTLNAQFCPSILPIDNIRSPIPPMGLTLNGIPLPIPSLLLYGTGSIEAVGGLPGAIFLSPNKPLIGKQRQSALRMLENMAEELVEAGIKNIRASELQEFKFHCPTTSKNAKDERGVCETPEWNDEKGTKEDLADMTLVEKLRLIARVREWIIRLKDLDFFEKIECKMSTLGATSGESQRPLPLGLTHDQLNTFLAGATPGLTPNTPLIGRETIFTGATPPPTRPIYCLPKACGAAVSLTVKYINGE